MAIEQNIDFLTSSRNIKALQFPVRVFCGETFQMKFKPYLSFAGNCREAFGYYEKYLGGRIKATFSWKNTPLAHHVPEDWGDKVIF